MTEEQRKANREWMKEKAWWQYGLLGLLTGAMGMPRASWSIFTVVVLLLVYARTMDDVDDIAKEDRDLTRGEFWSAMGVMAVLLLTLLASFVFLVLDGIKIVTD